MTALRVEEADRPIQPEIGQGEICASCLYRASGQMCARDVDEPMLTRRSDGTEACSLFENMEGEE